jgi:hypothetical protein
VSNRRLAQILNGSIVLAASLMTCVEPRWIWIILFMGASLIFSGTFDFCGFQVILDRLRGVMEGRDSRTST